MHVYDAFISYRRGGEDEEFAHDLRNKLQAAGYNVAIDGWDFVSYESFVEEMERCIKQSRFVIGIISPRYMDSGNCKEEAIICKVRDMRDRQRRFIKITIAETEQPDWLYNIVGLDFSDPKPRFDLYKKLFRDLGSLINPPLSDTTASEVVKQPFNVPPRNPFIIRRNKVLNSLHKYLQGGATALSQPPAVNGLGGIGKTQTAIEYAHWKRDEYAAVFWVVAETETDILSGFSEIARLLELQEQDDAEQARVIKAVQKWLANHENWLLILDNADNLALAHKYLPREHRGHVIYTTRSSTAGPIANLITVETFTPEEGARLLLLRATRKVPVRNTPEWKVALEISNAVGGLPLALEQAGAFMEENHRSASEYLQLYKTVGVKLLEKYNPSDHASVTVTFSLAFKELVKKNPAAADLLRLCAFLSPDNILEGLFTDNPEKLKGDLKLVASQPLEWAELIGQVCRGSLLTSNLKDRSLTIHRIVQDVLREEMNAEEQVSYVNSAVELLSEALHAIEIDNWPLYEQRLPHSLEILQWTEELGISTPQTISMASLIGLYLYDRAQYEVADIYLERALRISESRLGKDHPDTMSCLNNLAMLYERQGKYETAETFYKQALKIRELQLGKDHLDTATTLNNLANHYIYRGRYKTAVRYSQRALSIRESQLGKDHLDTANSLNSRAYIYRFQGKYETAETFYKRALKIREAQLGSDHPSTAVLLCNLASLYVSQYRYEEAEPLLERALRIFESRLGKNHPDTANSLSHLSNLYESQGRYEEAEPLYERALKIRERQLGSDHPYTANSLNDLANVYESQGRYEAAEPLYERALSIFEKRLGPDHPKTLVVRENYQDLLSKLQNPQQ